MSLWDCSAFRSLELGKCHWPLQAALSGSIIKAPGFAGGYLLPGITCAFRDDYRQTHRIGTEGSKRQVISWWKLPRRLWSRASDRYRERKGRDTSRAMGFQ